MKRTFSYEGERETEKEKTTAIEIGELLDGSTPNDREVQLIACLIRARVRLDQLTING